MKRSYLLIALLLCLFVTLPTGAEEQLVKDFTLPSATDGALIRLSDYAGKVVLINWWRTACGWSQKESAKLVALHDKYRDQGLVILGVSDDTSNTVAQIPAYLQKYKISWPIGLNDQGEFLREIRAGIRDGTPGNHLVSRNGKVTYWGEDRTAESGKKLEETVIRLLAEPAPSSPSIKARELENAPPLALADFTGKDVTLADFAGKPLVVNYFTARTCDWTGGLLATLYRQNASRGLQVLGVNLFDNESAVQRCIDKHKITYSVVRGDEATQMAWIGKHEGWATFFVTSDGKMFKRIVDSMANGIEAPVFRKYAEYMLAYR